MLLKQHHSTMILIKNKEDAMRKNSHIYPDKQ